ncbi:membrane hypothetical protein [Candidatus Zixiibacteriota bacterium]|nr:membrane hypothetical protein [candidate division Zixibacteria bacterium]
MIVSFELLGYCLLLGAIYLILVDLFWGWLESKAPLFGRFPRELIEPKTIGLFVSSFIIEFVFLVLLPAVVYGWFYIIIPFSGVRGGIAVALFLVMFGMLPLSILLLFRIRIPVVYVLFQLLGLTIKVSGVLVIIGYLYSL